MQSFLIWRSLPFLRILLPFIAGIIVENQCESRIQAIAIAIFCLWVSGYFISVLPIHKRYRWRGIKGLLLYGLLFYMGHLIVYLQQVKHHPQWYGHSIKNEEIFVIEIIEPLTRKEHSFKSIASVKARLHDRKTPMPLTGKIVVYFPLLFNSIKVGDELLVRVKPTRLINNGSPGAFELATYYARQQLFHQVYVSPQNMLYKHTKSGSNTSYWQYPVRTAIVQQLHHYIKDSTAAGLAAAILIGYKDELDREIYQTYAKTGVVHVIAISGMHLGLIYWIFQLLTLPLKRLRFGKWIRLFLQIGGVWGFTILTGSAPSILRAAVMITCLMIGQMTHRKGNMLNSLCASAFLLLCINPWWLWDAGFLLSYTALAGILIYQQRIYHSITFAHSWADYIWKFNSVTIAAQILTTPLSLYYFHQFPNYFLLSNMIAVPLSTVLLFLEIILCTLGYLTPLGRITGFFIEVVMYLLNQSLSWLSSLPGALSKGFQWSPFIVFAVYGCIICMSCYLILKIRKHFIYTIFFLGIIELLQVVQFYRTKRQCMLIVYPTKKIHTTTLINGSTALTSCDTELAPNILQITQQIHPTLQHLFISRNSFLTNQDANNFWITSANYTFYFLRSNNNLFHKSSLKKRLPVLIVSSNFKGNPYSFLFQQPASKVIADGTVSSSQIKAWQAACAVRNIPFHAVVEKGAFVMNLR